MSSVRFGPSFLPDRDDPDAAIRDLLDRGYSACEIDFGRGFWMSWEYAKRLGECARENGIALSVHAPIPAFLGHLDRAKKYRMAVGMLDHSAGIARECGAGPVVFHPGFLLGRDHQGATGAVVEQLADLRERLEAKGRDVPFGVEVMGRVSEFGTLDDVVAIASQLDWVRPVIDFAHLHAVTDGGFTDASAFTAALAAADAVIEPGAPFHVHFSDISYANRNEKWHLPYGQGTLRAGPLAEALAGFERPAVVIGESPDEPSNQAIRAILAGEPAPPVPAGADRLFES